MALPFYFYYERRIDMWTNLICKSRKFLKKNGSTILTCMGVTGVVGTAIMAVKATPKALELIEDAKKEKGEDLTKLQTIVIAAPAYIPSDIFLLPLDPNHMLLDNYDSGVQDFEVYKVGKDGMPTLK